MHSLASVSISVFISISRCCLPTYLPSTRRIVPPGSSRAAAAQAGYLFLFAVQVHRLSFSLLQCTHRSPPHCHLHPLHVQYLLCLLSLSRHIISIPPYSMLHSNLAPVLHHVSPTLHLTLTFTLTFHLYLYLCLCRSSESATYRTASAR